jgi:hypothetical protein
MSIRRALPLAVLLLAVLAVTPAHPVVADADATSVSVKGDVVTITVNIDAPGVSKKEAKAWKADAESVWNEAFGRLPYKCFKLQLVVNVTPQSKDFEARPDRHLIYETNGVNGVVLKPHGDTTYPYGHATDGAWGDLPEGGFAHEVGHLIGLGDDYTEVSQSPRVTMPLPGRAHTLMGDGGPVDKALVDRLGDVLRKAGKLPSCWTGTLHSETERKYVGEIAGGNGACTDAWDGTISFVTNAGNVSGSGTLDLTSPAKCDFPTFGSGEIQEYLVKVTGTEEHGRFALEFTYVGHVPASANESTRAGIVTLFSKTPCKQTIGPELSIPKTAPDRAAADIDLSVPFPCSGPGHDVLSSTTHIELKTEAGQENVG